MPNLAAVVIIHGNAMLRQLVRMSIEQRIGAKVIAEAGDFPRAVKLAEQLATGQLQARVAILGLKLEPNDIDGETGRQIYDMLRERVPGVKIAVFSPLPFSVKPGDVYIAHTSSQALNQLVEAVRALLNGKPKTTTATDNS